MILGLLTALAAIFVFGAVVLIHELGHFLAARRYGIFVQEFSIGFGPALWSRVRGGTRFSVRLIPLGGYNAMPGEESEADPPAGSRAAQSTAVSGRPFSEAGPWQRFFVILSGAAMNFVLGYLVLVLLLSLQGPIASCVIYGFLGEEPSSQASGLQAGDEILSVNGHICFVAEDVIYELQRAENYTAPMTVRRGGEIVQLPAVRFAAATGEDGQQTMVLDFQVYGIARTPHSVAGWAARYFAYYARAILRGFADLACGRAGINQLSGPVGVVTTISQAVQYGWQDLLSLTALLSINLGIFNLLPIPALDGCKLLFYAFEGVTKRAVPLRVQAVVNAAGLAALLMLMVAVTFSDITKLL